MTHCHHYNARPKQDLIRTYQICSATTHRLADGGGVFSAEGWL